MTRSGREKATNGEAWLGRLLTLAHEFACVIDPSGAIRAINPHWQSTSAPPFLHEWFDPDDRARLEESIATALKSLEGGCTQARLSPGGLPVEVRIGEIDPNRLLVTITPTDPPALMASSVARAAGAGLAVMDAEGRYLYVNDAYCEIYRYSREELLGQVFTMVVAPDQEETALANHQATIDKGRGLMRELEVLRGDGTPMTVDTSSRRIRLPDGQFLRLATVLDITRIRSNERRLAEAESRLRGFAESLPGAVYQFRHEQDGTYNFSYMSHGLHDIGRFAPDYPLDDFTAFMELIPEEDRSELQEAIDESERTLTPLRHRFRLLTPAGTLWVEARSTPTLDADGTVVCNGIIDDITDSVEAQRALTEESNLLGEIVENNASALLIADPDGGIVHANPRARELLRLEPGEHASLSDCEAAVENPDGTELPVAQQFLDTVIETGAPAEDMRFVFRWPDGFRQVISVNGSPVCSESGAVERIVLSLADISRGVEAHMRAILEHTPAMVYLKDLEGRFLYINPEFERHYGIADDWLRGRTVRELFPTEVADQFEARDRETVAERHLTRHEIRVPSPEGARDCLFEALKFPILDKDGEVVALAGVEIDVTDRREADRRLAEERKLLDEIVDTSVSALLVTDRSGRVVHANPRAREILRIDGVEDASIRDLPVHLTEPDDSELAREDRPLHRVLDADGPVEDMRLALHWEDGSRQILSINGSPVADRPGRVERIVFSFVDLTRETEARQRVERQHALFQAIFKDSSEIMISTDVDRRIRMVNRAFTDSFGYTEDEVIGQPTRMLYANDDDYRRIGESYANRSPEDGSLARMYEVRFVTKEGREFLAETVTDLLHDAEGEHIGYVGFIRDVTERKRAEEELRSQRERYASLVESTSAILWEADAATFQFTFVSGETENLLGYTPDDWTSDPDFWPKHMHPEDRDWASKYCEQATRKLENHTFEYRMLTSEGRTVWLRDIVTVIAEDDEPKKLVGAMIDITETKQAELELARSEARFRELYHRTPVMLHSIDQEGRLVAVSGYWLNHLGYSEDEVIGRPSIDILTEESARFAREEILPEFFRTGRCTNVPYQVVRADGSIIDVLLSAVAEHDADNNVVRSLAVMTDVTEQRRAEAQYRDLFNNASEGIYRTTPDGRLLRANPALAHMHGYETEAELLEATGDIANEWYVHTEDRQAFVETLEREDRADNFESEVFRHATGERIWISENARVVRDGQGEIEYFEGTCVDITWRRQKDQELAHSEARFRTLYHNTPVMLFSADKDGVIVDVNEYWLHQLGYARDEVIGNRIIDFFTHASRSRAESTYLSTLKAEGLVEEQEYRLRCKDGDIREVLLSSVLVHDEEGEIEGALSVLTDITERRRLEADFRDIFENTTEGMYRSTPEGRLVQANPALARMQGFATPEELLAAVEDLNTDWYTDPAARREMVKRLEQEGYIDAFEAEVRPLNRDGRIWTSETVHATRDGKGNIIYYEGTIRDITAEYKSRAMAQHRNTVLEMIARDDPVTGIMYEIVGIAEQQQERLTAAIFLLRKGRLYSAAAPGLSNSCIEVVDGASASEIGGVIQDALHSDNGVVVADLADLDEGENRFVDAMKSSGYGAIVALPFHDQEGTVLGILAGFAKEESSLDRNCTDMLREMAQIASIAIEQHRLSEALMRQAQYDPLTELPNRALLSDRLERTVHAAERANHEVGVLLLDLDEFKLVNDSLGHSAGDELLKEVATRLQDCLRAGDTVARLGGDEFVVVVPLHNGSEYCTDIAERILAALQKTVCVAEQEIAAHPSMGISIFPQDGRNPEALLKAADTAMYAAKHAGKNQYHYFAENMNRKVSDRLQIESELHDAIRDGALELHYQPRVSLADGRICGAEGLIRWRHPERGLLLPGVFIDVAERGPLIGKIDRMVIEQAVHQIATLQKAGHSLVMSVNLSAGELHEAGFAIEMARMLEESRVDPSGLELEITESMLMRDFERASAQLVELKASAPGLRIAIDDFGSGYSSLNYLRYLPVDTLKIDRSFVVGLAEGDETAAAIAKTIVELAHNLHMTVVAEGIEMNEQLRVLRNFGCEEGQGFLFDPALPIDEFRERLTSTTGYSDKASFPSLSTN